MDAKPQTPSTRPLLWLFAAGAAAATVSLVLGPAPADRAHIAGIWGATWFLAVVLCLAPKRLPRWAVHVFLACGTLLVEWVILVSGDATSPYPLLYFWVATCAFCFLNRVEAAAQGALTAVAYAGVLFLAPTSHGAPGLRLAVFVVAVALGGMFIGTLRARHDGLMSELQRVSRADPVSGLLDGRGFDEALASELERSRRSGSRFGVIVGTLDDYDVVPPADRETVLRTVGAAVASVKREIDIAARLGEDEFAILATYTDERGADVLGERMRTTVRQALQGDFTMSLGVASHPHHGASAEMLMRAARDARADAVTLGGDRSLIALSTASSIEARLSEPDVSVIPVIHGT